MRLFSFEQRSEGRRVVKVYPIKYLVCRIKDIYEIAGQYFQNLSLERHENAKKLS